MAHGCHPRIQEAEAGGWQPVRGQLVYRVSYSQPDLYNEILPQIQKRVTNMAHEKQQLTKHRDAQRGVGVGCVIKQESQARVVPLALALGRQRQANL